MLCKIKQSSRTATVNPLRGFTVAELVVVCGIIGILSLVIMAGYRTYSSQSLLQSLMYEMAVSVREAQVFGSAVKSQSSSFDVDYGVKFSTQDDGSQYVILSRPVGSSATTPVNTFTITRSNQITGLYSCPVGWADISACTPQTDIYLYFKRPHFDTDMESAATVSGPVVVDTTSDAFVIVVTGPTGTRELHLYRSGRVAIR